MKILFQRIMPNRSGTVKIIPEEEDDLWAAHNLISFGDVITTQTTRKIHQTTSSGKNKNPCRIRFDIEISVASVEDYAEGSTALRVSGKARVGNEHINAGTFHSLELEKGKEFTLQKENWTSKAMETLEKSGGSGYNLGVVLMQEGLANLFLVGKNGSKRCAKIDEQANSKSGLNNFFESVLCALTKHLDFDVVRCVVIGSPGRIKDEFRGYMLSKAQKSSKLKSIENHKSCIVLLNTSSGREGCLNEVLKDAKVMNFVKDTKAATEIRAMKELNEKLAIDPDCVRYGLKSVEAAHEMSAIKTLMISDKLIKSTAEVDLRQKYAGLVASVKEAGGKVIVFSPMHVTAEELAKLTGVAAILRFPVPELDGMELV